MNLWVLVPFTKHFIYYTKNSYYYLYDTALLQFTHHNFCVQKSTAKKFVFLFFYLKICVTWVDGIVPKHRPTTYYIGETGPILDSRGFSLISLDPLKQNCFFY